MKYRLLILTLFIFCLPIAVVAQKYARVISRNANLRDAPSVSSDKAEDVVEDTVVKILDQKLPWYVVRIGNRVGWMHGDTLEFVNTSTPSPRLSEQSITPDYTPKTSPPSGGRTPRSSSANSVYIRGPRGGCYYIRRLGPQSLRRPEVV